MQVLRTYWAKKAFTDYCFNEKKPATIAYEKKKDVSTVRRNFDRLHFCRDFQRTSDNHINIVFDGVYFGRSLCYIVCRAENKTIYFRECPETIENIGIMLDDLESMGYVFKSFTVYGRKGVKKVFETALSGCSSATLHITPVSGNNALSYRKSKDGMRQGIKCFVRRFMENQQN